MPMDRARQTRVVRVQEPAGTLEIFMPRQDLVVTFVEGQLLLPMAERWIEALERHFARGRCFHTFHDWEKMTGYESKARQKLTSWVVASIEHIASATFLTTDRMVKMGVTAAGVATAFAGLRMQVTSERELFESALQGRLTASRAPPSRA